jgi:protoporphyrinogen/coproporphyrinogen III oxidase
VPTQTDIAIVGGGITGLAAALWLAQHRPEHRVMLFEREPRLGGKIITEHVGELVIEGGPDSFLASKPHGMAFCHDVGIENQLIPSRPENRKAYVVRDGQLYPIPDGLTGLIPSRLQPIMDSPLLTPEGKARFALEPTVPAGPQTGDESLAGFIERRFGAEVFARLIEPLMAGIYAGDGRHLSLAATFPQLREMERLHGSVLRGIQAQAATPPTGQRPGFVTPIDGMGQLVKAACTHLAASTIAVNGGVKRLARSSSGFDLTLDTGETVAAHGVIIATPAYAAASLLSSIDIDLAHALDTIPYVSTATISLAYPANALPHPLNGSGYIVPRAEGTPILACTWVSSKFTNRAPDGTVLLRGFIGRSGQEESLSRSDEELVSLVQGELKARLGVHAPPEVHRVYRWPRGIPQYSIGHLDRLRSIETALAATTGLQVAGAAYHGVGIPDCIASGEQAAISVAR